MTPRVARISVLLSIVLLFGISYAQVATLSWDAPTTNEDGTPLTDLEGYRLYGGDNSGGPYVMIEDVGDVLTFDVHNEAWEGQTKYFVATAYDTSGNESVYSNEVVKTFPMVAPNPPILR